MDALWSAASRGCLKFCLEHKLLPPHESAESQTLCHLALGVGGISYAFIAAIALGFAVGAEVDLIGYFTARYFGLANYGTIYGVQYSVFSLGAGISPVLAGYIWDVNGNYDVALIGGAVLLAVAVVVALTLPRFEDVAEQDPAIKHA